MEKLQIRAVGSALHLDERPIMSHSQSIVLQPLLGLVLTLLGQLWEYKP